jgi:chemotaxis protein CheD
MSQPVSIPTGWPVAALPCPKLPCGDAPQRLFILPGGLAFSSQPGLLRTLLGSCVSVVAWHPHRRIGGMCHYLLADRPRCGGGQPDGRYGDDALTMIEQRMAAAGTLPAEYVASIYGGANVVDFAGVPDIGRRNIDAADAWCRRHGMVVIERDVGGRCHRVIEFNVGEGHVRVREGASPARLATASATEGNP